MKRSLERTRRVAAPDGPKSETFLRDLKILINLAAEHPGATALTTVRAMSVWDAGDHPD